MTDFDVRIVEPQVTAELRRSVLRPNLSLGDPLPGDDLDGVVHLGAFRNGEVIGACFVVAQDCDFVADGVGAWRLRSMATSPSARGTGAGTAVLAKATDVARSAGASVLWCHARDTAVGFYEHHGWVIVGDPFEEIGIEHRNMYLAL